MLAVERKATILDILTKEKFAKVEALAEQFGVSVMTIRRDLEKCEQEGLVLRCHGGAVLKERFTHEVLYADKMVSDLDAKEAIAEYATRFVTPGAIIFLDAGTTIFCLAKKIVTVPDLTVVTNDLAIASLMSETKASVIMLGGLVANSLGSTHGHMTERMLEDLRIETAFLGGQTVNQDFDLFNTNETKAHFRRLVLQRSDKAYLLMDATKFYKQTLFKVHKLSEYTGVITDKPILDTEQEYLTEHDINLISIAGQNALP